MAEPFQEQGGASTMDPGRVRRWLTSRVMTRLCRPERMARLRAKAEQRRKRAGQRHVVEVFYQPDDSYSHLLAQVLPAFAARYDVELICHLVAGPGGRNVPEPELLTRLSRYDARCIAPGYGLTFPGRDDAPPPAALSELAGSVLGGLDNTAFVENVAAVGRALWSEDELAMSALAETLGRAPKDAVTARFEAGNTRRAELGHYAGGMLYYAGEWYWGVDRLYHLEERLAALGADRSPGERPLVQRPVIDGGPLRDDGSLTLEVFPSLRSPYTAISFDRALKLADDSGVTRKVRPVLPMVMRGAPITRQKGMYIFWDTAREARAAGVPFGPCYDPIGEPVRRAYALYPWACEQGRGNALISAFLHCAFARGVNTNREAGMREVVEAAGLDWAEAKKHRQDATWQAMLEANRLAMYAAGLWGVPSFRLLDASGSELLALWGQDRLWVLAQEIQRQLAARR